MKTLICLAALLAVPFGLDKLGRWAAAPTAYSSVDRHLDDCPVCNGDEGHLDCAVLARMNAEIRKNAKCHPPALVALADVAGEADEDSDAQE